MLKLCIFLSFFSLVVGIHFSKESADETLVPGAKGKEVVEAAYSKLRPILEEDDHRFLVRIAWLESNYGENQDTYKRGYDGGIWQISKTDFLATKDTKQPRNATLFKRIYQIRKNFKIDWFHTNWSDLRKPFYSLLSSYILLSIKDIVIPSSIQEQGKIWSEKISTSHKNIEPISFENEISQVESCDKNSNIQCKFDMSIVLDGSESIGSNDFVKAKKFLTSLVACILSTGSGGTSTSAQIGLIVYSDSPEIAIPLSVHNNISQLQDKIIKVKYPRSGTQTDTAIELSTRILTGSPREDASKISILLTDGRSNNRAKTLKAAKYANKKGILSLGVGIGENIENKELNEVAHNKPERILLIKTYSALNDILFQIKTLACSKPQEVELGDNVTNSISPQEVSYYEYDMPSFGINLNLKLDKNSKNGAIGYYSYSTPNPSAAHHNGIIYEGQNLIPNPKYRKNQNRHKRSTSGDEDENIDLESMFGSYNDTQVDEEKNAKVFIAIVGQRKNNNTQNGSENNVSEKIPFEIEVSSLDEDKVIEILSKHGELNEEFKHKVMGEESSLGEKLKLNHFFLLSSVIMLYLFKFICT